MAMITVNHRGNFDHTERFFKRIMSGEYLKCLERAGEKGVEALAAATPVRSGKTAASWTYEIERSRSGAIISWLNTYDNIVVNIAIIIQYGHGTGTGGYVAPVDYINPAMESVFQDIADELWEEVTSA